MNIVTIDIWANKPAILVEIINDIKDEKNNIDNPKRKTIRLIKYFLLNTPTFMKLIL